MVHNLNTLAVLIITETGRSQAMIVVELQVVSLFEKSASSVAVTDETIERKKY